MTTVIATQLLIDPQRLLRVAFQQGGRDREVVAVTCRYVPVDNRGQRQVAIEVAFDPDNERPSEVYYCPEQRLSRLLLAPGQIRRISPYA